MKIIFGYYEDRDFGLTEYSEIEFSPTDTREKIEKKSKNKRYLLTAIMEDFPYIEILSDFYDKIKDFENGKRDELFWDGQAFQHKITKEKVVFINTIFGVCEEYPIWHCKFKEYVKTLKSWKEFLELPIKIQTKIELEV